MFKEIVDDGHWATTKAHLRAQVNLKDGQTDRATQSL